MSIDEYRGTARAELAARDQIIMENAELMWAAASFLAADISRSIKASSLHRRYEAFWEKRVSTNADPELTSHVCVRIKGENPIDRTIIIIGFTISKSVRNARVALRGRPLSRETHLQALTAAEQAIAQNVEERNLRYGNGCAAAIAALLIPLGALPTLFWF